MGIYLHSPNSSRVSPSLARRAATGERRSPLAASTTHSDPVQAVARAERFGHRIGSAAAGGPVQLAKPKSVSYFDSRYARFVRKRRRKYDVNGRNLATAKVYIGSGINKRRRYITRQSQGRHSEGLIRDKVDRLEQKYGKNNVDVRWLYSELAPCGSDVHNCHSKVKKWFPNARIRYSIAYPDGSKAQRRRGPQALKRFQTRLRQIKKKTHTKPKQLSDFKPSLKPVFTVGNPGIEL